MGTKACAGCPTGEFYLNGFCHDHCPDTYFASNHSFSGAVSFADIRLHTDASASNGTKANETSPDWWMLVCEPCDRSCFTCVGPTDWDCVSCATPYTFDANHTCARVGGGSPGGETFTGYLDFLSHHRVYAVLAVLVLCALCALVVFGGFYVTVHSGLCESWSCCSGPGGRHGARLGAAYSRVGGSGARLLDGAGPELRDQHHPLLSDRDGELDDFDGKADDDIFSEVIHYDKYSGNITRTPI